MPAQTIKKRITAHALMTDRDLLGDHFLNPSFWPTKTLLQTIDALDVSTLGLEFYRERTRRKHFPTKPFREVWLQVGRRAWKTYLLALQAIACLTEDYSPYLGLGERATIMIVSQNKDQAAVCMGYILGFLSQLPMLEGLITKQNSEVIEFSNGITIAIRTASWRSTRGYAIPCLLLDEIAFWRSEESANPDREIINALRPSMIQFPNSRLFAASSPYTKSGELWRMNQNFYGVEDSRVLFWQSPSQLMNPTITDEELAYEYRKDPGRAKAEYGGEFRADEHSIFDRRILEGLFVDGVHEIAPVPGVLYQGGGDPSGSVINGDSYTGGVAHKEGGVIVLDALREWKPPFDPATVTAEFCKLLKTYGISKVHGDKYGGDWVASQFREHGVLYEQNNKSKDELYGDLLPLVNAGQVELLDNPDLIEQLISLERKSGRGRMKIDHPAGKHDDLANVTALLFDLFRDDGSELFMIGSMGNLMQTEKSIQYGAEEDARIQRENAERRERDRSGSSIFDDSMKKKLW